MMLELRRRWLGRGHTLGELYVDGQFACFTLEDTVRVGPKVYGKTAIPAGDYPIELAWSPRYGRFMPRLIGVPGFEGILIHAGNTAEDTHGCLLVGDLEDHVSPFAGKIIRSRAAFTALFAILEVAQQRGEKIRILIREDVLDDRRAS